ncbi:MAG: MerR family transcriptional regulator [Rubrivivax sp.]|nr:MerR family transcriptional regulator [Rubrivivax sp.]
MPDRPDRPDHPDAPGHRDDAAPARAPAAGEAAERYGLDELAALAGVTARTVRYYIAEGLVSRPLGEKRGAHYARRHLEQLLLIRRWTDAGLSLTRVRELIAGAPEEAPPRRAAAGSVEVWSRFTVADGLEVHVEPGRAGLTPGQLRSLARGITALYRQVRGGDGEGGNGGGGSGSPP